MFDEHYALTPEELRAWDMWTGASLDKVARTIKMTPRRARKLLARIKQRIKAQGLADAPPGQADFFAESKSRAD